MEDCKSKSSKVKVQFEFTTSTLKFKSRVEVLQFTVSLYFLSIITFATN